MEICDWPEHVAKLFPAVGVQFQSTFHIRNPNEPRGLLSLRRTSLHMFDSWNFDLSKCWSAKPDNKIKFSFCDLSLVSLGLAGLGHNDANKVLLFCLFTPWKCPVLNCPDKTTFYFCYKQFDHLISSSFAFLQECLYWMSWLYLEFVVFPFFGVTTF